jgi:ACT domain-containing protein
MEKPPMPDQLKANHPKSAHRVTLLLIGMLSAMALPACSAAEKTMMNQMQSGSAPPSAPVPTAAVAKISDAAVQNTVASAPARKSRPQLIKRAELTLVVKSIDKSMNWVGKIVQKQQGDVLGFQDNQPIDNSKRQTASMQLRVPSQKLEVTLDELAKLGTVQSRSLTAEDVSDQLVDFQARLKNLRKSEEAVLKILERSGSVSEVLKVSQELSNIRESIERISAQLNNLQNQVAYSTITLNLEAPVSAAPPPQEPVGLQVQETWGKATHSVNQFTMGLLGLSIWLFAYSPYFLLIAAAVYGYRKLQQQKSHRSEQKPLPPST